MNDFELQALLEFLSSLNSEQLECLQDELVGLHKIAILKERGALMNVKNFRFYVTLSCGCIGYISSICMCEECIDRGETEVFIHSLNDEYLDCIKFNNLFDKSIIVNMDRSIEDLSIEHSQAEINRMIAELYEAELRKAATNS